MGLVAYALLAKVASLSGVSVVRKALSQAQTARADAGAVVVHLDPAA